MISPDNKVLIIPPIIVQEKEKKKLRVCSYSRVSRDNDDAIHSLYAQTTYWLKAIQDNPGWEYVDSYYDKGISGKSMDKRENFLRMLSDCRKGKIDLIVTKSIARFARNLVDTIQTVRELMAMGIHVIFEKECIDTRNMNSEMKLSIFSTLAQEELISFSENMRWSVKKRMASGEYIVSASPYGYRIIHGEFVIYEKEAKIVRWIFQVYLKGYGTYKIAQILRKKGIKKSDGTSNWLPNIISYILQNERYMGDALLGKNSVSDVFPFKRLKNRGEKEMYYIENANPALIDRATFEATLMLLRKRKEHFYKDTEKKTYALSKMVYCQECGSAYRRKVGYKDKIYWTCHKHTQGLCDAKQIEEAQIYGAFVKMFNRLKQNAEYIIEPMITELDKLQTPNKVERVRLDRKIFEMKEVLHIITLTSEKSSSDFFQELNEVNAEISRLKSERTKLLQSNEVTDSIRELKKLKASLQNEEAQAEFNEKLFRQLVDRVKIDRETNITFLLKMGLELHMGKDEMM